MNFCKDLPGQLGRVVADALLIFGAPENGLISEDLSVYSFPQMWGSTALGHGGIGGCAMSTAQTWVVFSPNRDALVYFGDRLAYGVPSPSDEFLRMMRDANMPGKHDAGIAALGRDGIVNFPSEQPQWRPMQKFTIPLERVVIYGPHPCPRCGGEYGEHRPWCRPTTEETTAAKIEWLRDNPGTDRRPRRAAKPNRRSRG